MSNFKKIVLEFILIALLGSLNASNPEVATSCPSLFNFLFENAAPIGKIIFFLIYANKEGKFKQNSYL
jgi:hypothetical protein